MLLPSLLAAASNPCTGTRDALGAGSSASSQVAPLSLSLQLPASSHTDPGVFGVKRQLVPSSELLFGCLGYIPASRLPQLGDVWVRKAAEPCLRVIFCLPEPCFYIQDTLAQGWLSVWGDALLARCHWSSDLAL